MSDQKHFITKIHIDKLLNLENITIGLSPEKRQHLLLTGKNGSGKTSLLNAIHKTLSAINKSAWIKYKNYETTDHKDPLLDKLYNKYSSGVNVEFKSNTTLDTAFSTGSFITAF